MAAVRRARDFDIAREEAALHHQWKVPPGIVWERIGREAVVVDASRRTAWVLNSTASDIWARICSGAPIEAIVAELAATGRDAKAVLAEVADFAGELVRIGLLGPGVALAYAPVSPAPSTLAQPGTAAPGTGTCPGSGTASDGPACGTTLRPA
ncbi:MAG: PqqD family protein, partial [Planctomycetota bacterium]|nr:PqqD family protein [Planctomycetota bacterium]